MPQDLSMMWNAGPSVVGGPHWSLPGPHGANLPSALRQFIDAPVPTREKVLCPATALIDTRVYTIMKMLMAVLSADHVNVNPRQNQQNRDPYRGTWYGAPT